MAKRVTKEVLVPVRLLKRLLPLVIEGNNYHIEMGTAESDTDAELELEEILARAKRGEPKGDGESEND